MRADAAEDGGHLDGRVGDLPVGEAEDPVAGGGVDLVAPGGAGLLGGGAVVAQAVGLDDQAVVGEEEVGLITEEMVLGQRDRQAGRHRQGTEEDLQVRVREAEDVAVEEGGEPLHAGLALVAVERGAEGLGIHEVELVGLVDGALEAQVVEFGRQVDQGLDRIGDRDAAPPGDGFGR